MNTRKSLTFLLISTLLLGGFPDFRMKPQDSPLLSDTYTWISVPSTTYDITQMEFPKTFPSPEELIATPTPAPTPTPKPTPTPAPTATPKPTPKPTSVPLGKTESKKQGKLTFNYPEPAPLNTKTSTYTMLVNKEYPLSSKYIPYMVEPNVEIYHKGINERRYLQPIAATALEEMFAAAEEDGLHLVLRCGFRSYRLQHSIYSWNLKTYGYYEVSRYHALAGTSEHQTGLAVDLCCEATDYKNDFTFLETQEYAWMLENAHLYGWILRYPEDKIDITGYNFEPWHFRYVGVELATYLKENDIVLEEYYGALPTSNLLAVPEEFWDLLSEEDFKLMEQDIAEYEKRMEELANQPTPTPAPTPEPDITDVPDPDETPDKEDPTDENQDDDSNIDGANTDDDSDDEDFTDADDTTTTDEEPDITDTTDPNDAPYENEDSFEDIPPDDTWEEDLLISEDPLDYL
ncbi:MAG: M15 family metallopeptidase [Lachnospiraceae bacterium]|nr:M15 family metallopeptidase [Lachnospiraceae bacterium]